MSDEQSGADARPLASLTGDWRNGSDAETFAMVARDLSEQRDREATAARILDLVRTLTGCEWAAIAELSDTGRLIARHKIGDAAIDTIAAIARDTGECPARQAARDRRTVRCADLATERRWPDYTQRMLAETPARSAVAYCLTLDGVVLGTMTLYASRRGHFTNTVARLADVYAEHAVIALAKAIDHDKVLNLQTALHTNREIAIAIGIVMARRGVDREGAFVLLRGIAQTTGRKLRDVAAQVALSGDLPETVTTRRV